MAASLSAMALKKSRQRNCRLFAPYCTDLNIEAAPDARLYAENFPRQAPPVSALVFRCSHWHIFAILPLEF
jgi:hypothetical protein